MATATTANPKAKARTRARSETAPGAVSGAGLTFRPTEAVRRQIEELKRFHGGDDAALMKRAVAHLHAALPRGEKS